MLGNYTGTTQTIVAVEGFDPNDDQQSFALFNLRGEEIEGPTYRRQTIKDMEQVGTDSYIVTFRPTKPGEIWSFMCLGMFLDHEEPTPSAVLVLPFILVLYGSIQGSYSFKLKPAKNAA